MATSEKKSTRGFASMDPEKRRAIASKAGKAAHMCGRAHEWTPEEAAAAGRIGGKIGKRRGWYEIYLEEVMLQREQG